MPIKLKNSIKSSAIQFQGRFAEAVRRILFTEIVSVSQESSVIHLFLSFFSNSISVPVSLAPSLGEPIDCHNVYTLVLIWVDVASLDGIGDLHINW